MNKGLDREKIREDALKLMNEFAAALEKIPEVNEEFGQERQDFVRKPSKKKEDKIFRQHLLSNAPNSRDGSILMEKKQW